MYILKIEKSNDFWQSHFAMKLPKEKFDLLCNNSIDNSELTDSLSSDFQNFVQNVSPVFGETYFDTMDKIMFCRICFIEISKALLIEHINSKDTIILKNILL